MSILFGENMTWVTEEKMAEIRRMINAEVNRKFSELESSVYIANIYDGCSTDEQADKMKSQISDRCCGNCDHFEEDPFVFKEGWGRCVEPYRVYVYGKYHKNILNFIYRQFTSNPNDIVNTLSVKSCGCCSNYCTGVK